MPQYSGSLQANNPAGKSAPLKLGYGGGLSYDPSVGLSMAFALSAATLVKSGPGRVARVSILVAGTAAGTINDIGTTGGAAVGNQLAVIPNTVGVITVELPYAVGLVIVPGTGQTVAVAYT